jgi:hypothetical protein
VKELKKEQFDKLKKMIEENEPTSVHHIEGLGTVKTYGELDLERLIKRLLKSSLMN